MERALFLIMAGGEGKRLRRLAGSSPKPLLRFGPSAKLIDFTLFNCLASGAKEVVVLTQYQGEMVERYLDRQWQSAFADRGARLSAWSGAQTPAGEFRGTADAVHQALRRHPGSPEHVVVLAADHVYRMDYRAMLGFHRDHGAGATVGTVELEWAQAHGLGLVQAEATGRVTGFLEKPDSLDNWILEDQKPLSSMGIYVFNRQALLQYLEQNSDPPLLDFGHDLLPRLSRDRQLYAHRFTGPDGRPGYWRDVGNPLSYWQAHMEILNGHGRHFFAETPLPGVRLPLSPGYLVCKLVGNEQWIYNSLISPTAKIGNALIEDSVIGPHVVVEDGASIEKSVVLDGAIIRKWTELNSALVGPNVEIKDAWNATHEIELSPEFRPPAESLQLLSAPIPGQPRPPLPKRPRPRSTLGARPTLGARARPASSGMTSPARTAQTARTAQPLSSAAASEMSRAVAHAAGYSKS